jgi:hypothetical protein
MQSTLVGHPSIGRHADGYRANWDKLDSGQEDERVMLPYLRKGVFAALQAIPTKQRLGSIGNRNNISACLRAKTPVRRMNPHGSPLLNRADTERAFVHQIRS